MGFTQATHGSTCARNECCTPCTTALRQHHLSLHRLRTALLRSDPDPPKPNANQALNLPLPYPFPYP